MVIMQTWFNEFVRTICPSENAMCEIKKQSKYITDQLVDKIDAKSGLSITAVLVLGCSANCPAIKNIKSDEYELDTYVYIEGKEVEKKILTTFLKNDLETIYAEKHHYKFVKENDFIKMIINSDIKITLNIIPVIQNITRPNYEWKVYLPEKGLLQPIDEVPKLHLYSQTRTSKSKLPVLFYRMAKLMNWWARCQGLRYKNNEMIFLTGNSFDKNIFPDDWFKALDQVFYYFSHGLYTIETTKNGVPVIIDPTNKEIGILESWNKFDIEKFRLKAQESYDKLYDAKISYDADNKKESLNYLKDIFGREFGVSCVKT